MLDRWQPLGPLVLQRWSPPKVPTFSRAMLHTWIPLTLSAGCAICN